MENLINCNLKNTSSHNEYYTPIQLRLPLDLETSISFDDPIYTFDEVMKDEYYSLIIEIDAFAFQKYFLKEVLEIETHYPNEEYDKILDKFIEMFY